MDRNWSLPAWLDRGPVRLALGAIGLIGITTCCGLALAGGGRKVLASEASNAGLAAKVAKAFPNTHVESVRCGLVAGLCEVTAGRTVFYVTPDARYALVGSVLDLKDRIDLTDRRMKELGQLEAVTSRLADNGNTSLAPLEPAQPQHTAATSLGILKVDLPRDNAIVHHPGAPLKLSVVTDLNCGYCKMLFDAIKTAPDIEVTEYPIQLLRPDSLDKAKLALCAKDREATANNIYFGGDVKVSGDCGAAEKAVEANTAFARAHGIFGTPTLIRADGQTNNGFMPIDQLRVWLKGGQA